MGAVTAYATAPASAGQGALRERESSAVAEAEAMADEHLAREEEVRRVGALVRWLDDLIRIPGTKLGIGLDPLIGAIAPGVGDAVTGAASLAVLMTAIRRKVPTIVVARMLLNIAIDTILGAVPVVGDVFDVLWRSNYRNLQLLERHQGELEPRARAGDYALVLGAVALVAASVAAPIVLWMWMISAIFG